MRFLLFCSVNGMFWVFSVGIAETIAFCFTVAFICFSFRKVLLDLSDKFLIVWLSGVHPFT